MIDGIICKHQRKNADFGVGLNSHVRGDQVNFVLLTSNNLLSQLLASPIHAFS